MLCKNHPKESANLHLVDLMFYCKKKLGYLNSDIRASAGVKYMLNLATTDGHTYLPKEIFPYLSEKLEISEARIYGVATFYENFSLEQKGKFVLKVCDGTACHVRKSIPILEALRKELGLSEQKKTTDDLMFTVETVSCLGACSSAPAVMVNDEIYPTMTPESAVALVKTLKESN